MSREFKTNLRKLLALLLVASMILSINTAYCVSEVYADGEDTYVTFSKAFVDFLSLYHSDNNTAIDTMCKIKEGQPGYGKIKQSDLASVTEMNILYDSNYQYSFSHLELQAMNFNELAYFPNLKKLTITGDGTGSTNAAGQTNNVVQIKSMTLPASLEELTLDGCFFEYPSTDAYHLPKDLFSGCPNLKKLTFTNNTFNSTSSCSKDVNLTSLKNLETAVFDGSQMEMLIFPDTGVTSPGLDFSAEGCKKLNTIKCDEANYPKSSFGGYLMKNVNLKGCTDFGSSSNSLDINGITTQATQTIKIDECYNIGPLNVVYNFTDAAHRVSIEARGVTKDSGSFTVGRSSESQAGLYKLTAAKGSFIQISANSNTYKGYFDGSTAGSSTDVAFIVFAQDKNKWDKEQLWKSNKDTYRRSYTSNPVMLCLGQVIEDNTPYFYTSEGTQLRDVTYTYKVDYTSAETYDVVQPRHASGVTSAISVDNTNKNLKTTATNPGIGTLTVIVSNGQSLKATQIIKVYTPYESVSIDNNGSQDILMDQAGDYTFKAKLSVSDANKDLVDLTMGYGNISWCFDRKDDNGQWVKYSPSGLTVATVENENVSQWDKSTGTVTLTAKMTVSENMLGQEFRVRGVLCNNKDKNNGGAKIESDNDHSLSAKVINVSQTQTEIGYGYSNSIGDRTLKPTYSIIEVPKLDSSYSISANLFTEYGSIDDCVILTPTGAPPANGQYKVEFNPTKSPEEIARMLYGITHYEDNGTHVTNADTCCRVGVKVTVTGANNYSKEYIKWIKLSGVFSVAYDANEGTVTVPGSETYYYLPEIRNTYWISQRPLPVVPRRPGYTFTGWFLGDTETQVKKLLNGDAFGNLELKAHWREGEEVPPVSDDNSSTESESNSGDSGQSQTPAPTPTPTPTVAIYTPPQKTTVLTVNRENADGTTTSVELHADGTIQESTPASAAVVAGMNTTINMIAPTAVKSVDIVVDKSSAAANAKIEKVTTVVEATTINGNINISPQMVTNLKGAAASRVGTKAAKKIDIQINTTAANGKPVIATVSSSALSNKATLYAYIIDPVTGGYIFVNAPIKYDKKIGLTINGLVGGYKYIYVSYDESKAIEKAIFNTVKVSPEFANTVPAVPGAVVDMTRALSPELILANVSSIEYSVSGNKAVINPLTGLLMINGNATKGTFTVKIKVTLRNGKTKTIKTKFKIQ